MNGYVLPGILGLLVGLLLHWTSLCRREGLQQALGLRRSIPLRSGLTALGWAMAMTALLCWLAVIDVDTIVVLPLSAGALLGGVLLGVAAGLCGFTPTTAFAGLASDNAAEALCVLAGCTLSTLLLPAAEAPLSSLRTLPPYSAATLFQVTLDEPFLLGGGFLGQGCAGLLLAAIALCIPAPRELRPPERTAVPSGTPAPEEAPPAPDNAPEETFVALLPGEEPLVIDTGLDEDAQAESAASESTGDEAPEDRSADDPEEDPASENAPGEESPEA